MTKAKRKYIRLAPTKWAELRAFWETGDHSLAELSDQYGVSPRAIQCHVRKHERASKSVTRCHKQALLTSRAQKERPPHDGLSGIQSDLGLRQQTNCPDH